MTRFARAKGSKSSNEKKPEEATSWLEMKNSVLSKKAKQPEKPAPKEEVKVEPPKESEWASLGDGNSSESLLKPNVGKKNKNKNFINNEGGEVKKLSVGKKNKNKNFINNEDGEVKKPSVGKKNKKKNLINSKGGDVKKKTSGNLENGVDLPENLKKKKKKKQDSEEVSEINKNKLKKKDKKRKAMENDAGDVQPKKKKKLSQTDEGSFEKGKEEQENAEDKKFNKSKKPMKSKHFKNESEGRNFRSWENRGRFDKQNAKKNFKNKNFEQTSGVEELVFNGEKIQVVKFQGFPVTLDDAERLKKLKSDMIKEGIPRAKLEAAIKRERRKAEKALSRLKKSVCFHCRGRGHLLSHCPELTEKENTGTGICYKCGSTEHSASACKVVKGTDFKFAECFICKEQGHIARQCPDNPRGLYPQGGACRECGDVTHLRKDCPKIQAQKAEDVVTVGLRSDRDLECLDEEIESREKRNSEKQVKRNSTIKF